MSDNIPGIIKKFEVTGNPDTFKPFGSGHIHDTFFIKLASTQHSSYILQKINRHVFPDISGLMTNIDRVTNHIIKKMNANPALYRKWQCLYFIPTAKNTSYYRDSGGNYWRLCNFIEDSHSIDKVQNPDQAFESGKAFGLFLKLISDMPGPPLHETIPQFHDLRNRLDIFYRAVKKDPVNRVKETAGEINWIEQHADDMLRIQGLANAGKIPERTTHNDTKVNNVLFNHKEQAVCVIDLDTVMPGLVHYDFGDAIRTIANTSDEDEQDLSKVSLNLSYFTSFTKGFLNETNSILTPEERSTLYLAPLTMTFIIGLRFLTDYIQGDVYYKIHSPRHNLQRARAQFQLVKSMQQQAKTMEDIIRERADNL